MAQIATGEGRVRYRALWHPVARAPYGLFDQCGLLHYIYKHDSFGALSALFIFKIEGSNKI